MKSVETVRPSPIAGHWYSANPRLLANEVDKYLQDAKISTETLSVVSGKVIAVMTPHAGLMYSGPVAAYAFAVLRGIQPEIVAVVSPMHYPYTEAVLTTAHSAYATPLGLIPVDKPVLELVSTALQQKSGLNLARLANDPEHSLEIELPFLQRVFQHEFALLPLMVRDPSPVTTRVLGEAMAEALKGRQALLVASTDLSHFYSQQTALMLDKEFLQEVERFSPEGVLKVEEEGRGFACGRGALAAVMWAAKILGADKAQVLHHATSGDVSGDFDRVVGYAAAVFYRS
jgi:hypothetical protein